MLTSILASNLSGVTNVFAAEEGYEQTIEQDAQGSAVGSAAESETAAEKEPAASVIENTEEAAEELSVDPDMNDSDVQDEIKGRKKSDRDILLEKTQRGGDVKSSPFLLRETQKKHNNEKYCIL